MYVKGARPGDALAVEILELRPGDWGWTAIIPDFGLPADELPEPWLNISEVDAGRGQVRFADGVRCAGAVVLPWFRIMLICVPVASSVWTGSYDGDGVERRAVERDHRRPLGSVFGEVTVGRLAGTHAA